jgi:hypothetical protein
MRLVFILIVASFMGLAVAADDTKRGPQKTPEPKFDDASPLRSGRLLEEWFRKSRDFKTGDGAAGKSADNTYKKLLVSLKGKKVAWPVRSGGPRGGGRVHVEPTVWAGTGTNAHLRSSVHLHAGRHAGGEKAPAPGAL